MISRGVPSVGSSWKAWNYGQSIQIVVLQLHMYHMSLAEAERGVHLTNSAPVDSTKLLSE